MGGPQQMYVSPIPTVPLSCFFTSTHPCTSLHTLAHPYIPLHVLNTPLHILYTITQNTQVSVARPQEGGGLWVATACQGPSVPHVAAARVLGVPQHRITMGMIEEC